VEEARCEYDIESRGVFLEEAHQSDKLALGRAAWSVDEAFDHETSNGEASRCSRQIANLDGPPRRATSGSAS
jgi:hypothetical protein